MYRRKLRLGDMLVSEKVITDDQLMQALKIQKSSGSRLGTVLIEQGLLTEHKLFEILERQYGIPYLDISTIFIDPKIPKLIPESLARKHSVIPVSLVNNRLRVAMSDPLDMIAQDDIRMVSGNELDIVLSPKNEIDQAINRYYDTSERAERAIEEFKAQSMSYKEAEEVEDSDVTNAPIVRLVNTIISQAVRIKASDIHIEPYEHMLRIRMRVDGELREMMTQSRDMHAALVTRIKIMGNMNISEKRIPQDGRIEAIIENINIDMRISVLPTVYGEKVVIRLLDRDGLVIKKEELGFTEHNLAMLNKMLMIPEGIILVTGPTGSGKTTTLYTLLKEMNHVTKNIITVEDPVEYRLDGINQVQVNVKAGLTFASGLRSILRQDPDVVMVGEIRDNITAEIATRAAITGHIVLSTIHTNDTVSTIFRLIDMEIPHYMVSSAVVGIIAQRLVKKICPKCGKEYQATQTDLRHLGMAADSYVMLRKGVGCAACGNTGYMGRTAIHEVLLVDQKIKTMISEKQSAERILEAAKVAGLTTLNETARELVLAGTTTIEELIRMTYQYHS